MTVQLFDVDVDPIELVPLRVYLVGQEPTRPRSGCVVPVLQWLADRFAANPRLESVLRVELVAIDSKLVQHLLFDSGSTSIFELFRPLEILLGRTRRPGGQLLQRVDSGLSVVVIPGDSIGSPVATPAPLVNDIQERVVWIDSLDNDEELTSIHAQWGSSRTVIARTSEAGRLTAILASFISTVVETQRATTEEWVTSTEVSDIIVGMPYAVD